MFKPKHKIIARSLSYFAGSILLSIGIWGVLLLPTLKTDRVLAIAPVKASNVLTTAAQATNPTDNAPPISNAPCAEGSDYCGFVNKYINPAINFLGIGFGLIITVTIIIAGIQYATAAGDPQKVNAAKKRIFNAVFALLVFAFMYAFLQWIVPGGLF